MRLMICIVLGGIVGLERGLKNRAAGFRTYMLVSLGSCAVMMINQFIYQATGTGDPVRMGAQVISGIGFLGAGTIIVTSRSQIKGLTTAAGLWASACIGLSTGIGFYELSIAGGICVFAVMTIFHRWEDFLRRNTRLITIYVELRPEKGMKDFLDDARKLDLTISNIQLETNHAPNNALCFVANAKKAKKGKKQDILASVRDISSVMYLEEL